MRALFLGGSQHGVLLNLHESVMYWDFPVIPTISLELNRGLPDEIQKFDRVRYKLSMISVDRETAIYTECGDALDILTRVRDWIVESDPGLILRTGRKPEPVYMQPKKP